MVDPDRFRNIYLHLFDRVFLAYCRAAGQLAQLVRYCDDFVILMRARVGETLEKVKEVLGRMELTLNEEKSRVVDAREGGFNFLGFTFCRKNNRQTGKDIILVEPSRKSQLHFREEVRRHLTGRWSHCLAEEEVLGRVNRYVTGWVNYFHLYNSTQAFRRERFFLNNGYASTCRSGDRERGLG